MKILEGANIKLASVVSDITGKSGHEMLLALVAGMTEAASMAQLARGVLREKIPQLERALVGQFHAHHRFLVAPQLAHIGFLDLLIERVGAEIATWLQADAAAALCLLQTLPEDRPAQARSSSSTPYGSTGNGGPSHSMP